MVALLISAIQTRYLFGIRLIPEFAVSHNRTELSFRDGRRRRVIQNELRSEGLCLIKERSLLRCFRYMMPPYTIRSPCFCTMTQFFTAQWVCNDLEITVDDIIKRFRGPEKSHCTRDETKYEVYMIVRPSIRNHTAMILSWKVTSRNCYVVSKTQILNSFSKTRTSRPEG